MLTSNVNVLLASLCLLLMELLLSHSAWPLNPPFKFPATASIDKMLVITTKPLPVPPKPPALYSGRPQWTFLGGPGTLLLASYSSSPKPIGPYNELAYTPGKYAACNGSSTAYDSAQRIWVDNVASLKVGKYLGGMPKGLASFRWLTDTSNSTTGVIVRVGNRTILSIRNLTPLTTQQLEALSAESGTAHSMGAKPQYQESRKTVQWPLYLPKTPHPANDTPVVNPVEFDLGHNVPTFLTAKASDVYINAATFTGYKKLSVQIDTSNPLASLSVPRGSKGTAMQPTSLVCP